MLFLYATVYKSGAYFAFKYNLEVEITSSSNNNNNNDPNRHCLFVYYYYYYYYNYRVFHKKHPLHIFIIYHSMLTNFNNSFTAAFSDELQKKL